MCRRRPWGHPMERPCLSMSTRSAPAQRPLVLDADTTFQEEMCVHVCGALVLMQQMHTAAYAYAEYPSLVKLLFAVRFECGCCCLPYCSPHDVLPVKPLLPLVVECTIITVVVVSLHKHAWEGMRVLMELSGRCMRPCCGARERACDTKPDDANLYHCICRCLNEGASSAK